MTQELSIYTSHTYTVDEMVQVWLHEMLNKSGSQRTYDTYENYMTSFRAVLHKQHLDLTSPDVVTLATLAQGWAAYSVTGRTIASATYNLRIATISSFYEFAKKRRWLKENPLD